MPGQPAGAGGGGAGGAGIGGRGTAAGAGGAAAGVGRAGRHITPWLGRCFVLDVALSTASAPVSSTTNVLIR
jgi:hypothetical protein